jgi:hypothetical protein
MKTKKSRRVIVSMPRERTVHLWPHEVLLSFGNDEGAEAFHDWWHEEGENRMVKWCMANGFELETSVEPEKL